MVFKRMTLRRTRTAVEDRTEYGIGAGGQNLNWELLDWHSIENSIRKLRQRIFRATKEQRWNAVRSLTKLMLRCHANLLASVRLATQTNKGKRTAGVDNQTALTPAARTALAQEMTEYKTWKVKPTKRIYIPKGNSKKLRPLGIPVMKDRVAQAIVKNALEPHWEARFEQNSYGFRPGRSVHDAIHQCWLNLNRSQFRVWVLDADIKGAFDNISHDFILDQLKTMPGRELVKQWLKAGYVENDFLHETNTGTPQGGVISPVLLNIALHGMETTLGRKYGVIRYADDFIVCAQTREEIERMIPKLKNWLQVRGLTLHPEKTRIVHINDGFNFLGFNVRRYRGHCLIKPQKEKVLDFLKRIGNWLRSHYQSTPEEVIRYLNPILRGWSNYYKAVVSKVTFSYVSHRLWQMLWRWSLRRHPNKGKHWVYMKYFQTESRRWWFHGDCINPQGKCTRIFLFDIGSVAIQRHVKVRGAASPDDPTLMEYWHERKSRRPALTEVWMH